MNLFKLMSNLGNLTKMQEEVQNIGAELAENEYIGKAGGDLVSATVNGTQQVIACAIDQKLVDDNDRELIEDLVVSAVNEALAEAKRKSAELMQQKLAEKFDMPELGDMLGNLMPKSP